MVLGGHTYIVVPQRIGRLKKRLGKQFSGLDDLSFESIADFVGEGFDRAHAALEVFIPELMPVHEFCGFASESAMNDPDAEEADDVGPTFPEVVTAFEVAFRLNRFDLFKKMGNVLSPELIRAYINRAVSTALLSGTDTTSATSSATPGPDTPSMISGTTPPTSESSGG